MIIDNIRYQVPIATITIKRLDSKVFHLVYNLT